MIEDRLWKGIHIHQQGFLTTNKELILLFRRLIKHGRLAHPVGQGGEGPLLEVPVVQAGEGGGGERHVHPVLHAHRVHGVAAHGAHAPPVQRPRHGPRHRPLLN